MLRSSDAPPTVPSVPGAAANADKVKGDTTFAGILGIHIDYVGRTNDGAHSDILGSIDFQEAA